MKYLKPYKLFEVVVSETDDSDILEDMKHLKAIFGDLEDNDIIEELGETLLEYYSNDDLSPDSESIFLTLVPLEITGGQTHLILDDIYIYMQSAISYMAAQGWEHTIFPGTTGISFKLEELSNPLKVNAGMSQYYMFRFDRKRHNSISESLYENWKTIESHMDYICDEFGFENLGQIPTHQVLGDENTLRYLKNQNGIFFFKLDNDRYSDEVSFEIRVRGAYYMDNSEKLWNYLKHFQVQVTGDGYNHNYGNVIYFRKDPKEMKTYNANGYYSMMLCLAINNTDKVWDLIKRYKSDPDPTMEEMSKMDATYFIDKMFKLYCNRSVDVDYSMLEVYRTPPDHSKMLFPVDLDRITLPYNLDRQFAFDVAPLFFEKVYLNCGLIFRCNYSHHSEYRITDSTRRLRETCPKDEIEDKIKKLGLDLKWSDIFIKKD